MKSKPLVTIITATYNSGLVLQRCIDSVNAQTYSNIEYIVIDGGSKDNTVDIIKQNEHIVTKWISERDEGVYDAWNKGIALASGVWIVFIGSDDTFYPNAIQTYVDFIGNSNQQFDYVSARVHITNSKDQVIRTFGWPWVWEKSKRVCTIAHPGSFHSKELFQTYGHYNKAYKICGDYELLLRAGSGLKAAYMNFVSLKMEVGGLSDSYKVYLEHYKVVTSTGKLSNIVASYDLIKEYSKFLVKRGFRYLGLNIALKK